MRKIIRVSGMGRRGPLPGKRKKVLQWVRSRIATGRIKPGERLPDRKWFRERFDIANYPVQLAFDELVADRLVRPVSGHGTVVAEKLPFERRYLLLLRSRGDDAGVKHFAPALRTAAKNVAQKRDVTFEVKELIDTDGDSVEYAEMLEDVRRHRYAGVFSQGISEVEHGMEVVTNVDDVPMAHFGPRSVLSQGNLVVSLPMHSRDFVRLLFGSHFEDCRRQGRRRVAVFCPLAPEYSEAVRLRELAVESGLEIVPNGYHQIDMSHWSRVQFMRLMDLFLRSDAGRAAEAVIFGDDNLLLPFVECCVGMYGKKAASRYFVSCHCNFPCPVPADFPVNFHGPDLESTISSFVDYAEDCLAGTRHPRQPELKLL